MPDIDIKSDLLMGVMNLIEAELHSAGSFLTTDDEKWLDIKKKIFNLRRKYMKDVEKEDVSKLHCFNKHILSASSRLTECGDKELRNNNKEKAIEYYKDSRILLELFIDLNWVDEKPKKTFINRLMGGNGDVSTKSSA